MHQPWRRLSLVNGVAGPAVVDQEVAPGVENLQLQFGVDVDQDNTVDRYINPGDPILDPADPAWIPDASVITARIWIPGQVNRTGSGIEDNTNYQLGDVPLGTFNDQFRRMLVSKTILLRNSRT